MKCLATALFLLLSFSALFAQAPDYSASIKITWPKDPNCYTGSRRGRPIIVDNTLCAENGWHLRGVPKDDRIQHIEDNLTRAAFGDRFKGKNPGGDYILLLRYKNSDRAVVVGFKDGVFLIEGIEGIGAVDVRGPPRPPAAPRSR